MSAVNFVHPGLHAATVIVSNPRAVRNKQGESDNVPCRAVWRTCDCAPEAFQANFKSDRMFNNQLLQGAKSQNRYWLDAVRQHQTKVA